MTVSMQEAKAKLSKLVELASRGEEIVIAKAGKAVAVLKPYKSGQHRRKPGLLAGKPLDMSGFEEADKEIEKLFCS